MKSISLTIFLIFISFSEASALTVSEVARDLACPCACPLVLEDCNMSCGLDWKNKIGEKIKSGKNKQEIIGDFRAKYGDACRITPVQRIHGKFFQYTRAFGPLEWTIFWAAMALWVGILFLAIYLLVRKFTGSKKADKEDAS